MYPRHAPSSTFNLVYALSLLFCLACWVPRMRVVGGPQAAPAEGLLFVCSLWMGVGWLTGKTHSKFKVLNGSGVAHAEFVFIALVRFREYCQNALKLISRWRLSLPLSVVCPIALNRLINIYQNHIVCLNLPRTHILLSIIFCLRMVCQVLDYVP